MKTTLLGLIVIITGAACASLGIGVSGIDISAYPPITPQNAHQLQQIKYFDAHEGVANAVSISADGMLVATGGMEEFGRSGGVRLWDLARGSQQAMTTYHDPVTRVAISPTQRIVAFGSYDGRIQLWNYDDTNAATSTLNNSDDVVTSLAFSPDGQKQIVGQLNSDLENVNVLAKGYLNGTNTGTVTVWDMR